MRVWQESLQQGSRLLALLAIADHADDGTGVSVIAVDDLVHRSRVSRGEIDMILAGLVADGEIGRQEYIHAIGFPVQVLARLSRYHRFGGGGYAPLPMFPVKTSAKIDPRTVRWVMERDAYRCRYCRTHYSLEVDHVYPVSRGGKNDTENLVTCCRWCNARKGARTPEEAGMVILESSIHERDEG